MWVCVCGARVVVRCGAWCINARMHTTAWRVRLLFAIVKEASGAKQPPLCAGRIPVHSVSKLRVCTSGGLACSFPGPLLSFFFTCFLKYMSKILPPVSSFLRPSCSQAGDRPISLFPPSFYLSLFLSVLSCDPLCCWFPPRYRRNIHHSPLLLGFIISPVSPLAAQCLSLTSLWSSGAVYYRTVA